MLDMGGVQLYGIVEANDASTQEADAFASTMLSEREHMTEAIIDRFDGLVIFDPALALREECDHEDDRTGFRLRTPICGYEGSGPMMSAVILAAYGFGDVSELYARINHGEDTARYLHFVRPDRFTMD